MNIHDKINRLIDKIEAIPAMDFAARARCFQDLRAAIEADRERIAKTRTSGSCVVCGSRETELHTKCLECHAETVNYEQSKHNKKSHADRKRRGEPVVWQPIETAPKDEPIIAYCNHEADPHHTDEPGGCLTLYAAHYEGLSHCETGVYIVEWGGAWDDRTYEDSSGGFMPDWWFVAGSEFEVAANPTHWIPLPAFPNTAPQPAARRNLETLNG